MKSVSRRNMLRSAAAAFASAAIVSTPYRAAFAQNHSRRALLQSLDEKIEAAMAKYHVPGVAVAVFYEGQEYIRGYGVTNVTHPQAVDGDTLFRIGSITKTFTGTALMRLVDRGRIDLNAPVHRYMPGLRLADKSVAQTVTVRQILNHSAGWLGDDYAGYGRGEDALAKYVDDMWRLPQLTAPGSVFAYNNAAVNLAGRLLEVRGGMSYEDAMRELLLNPLGLKRSGYFADTLVGYSLAASHTVENNTPSIDPESWSFPRSLNPTGGLVSSAREMLRYGRFHLGNGTASDGARVLSTRSLRAMHSNPGPGGTVTMEIDGVTITFWQRRTAQGIPVFEHAGSWGGQNADLVIVPQHNFAMVILTNATTGGKLIGELSGGGWALQHFVGLTNPPAVPQRLSQNRLAEYEGHYKTAVIPPGNGPAKIEPVNIELRAHDGGLKVTGDLELSLAFYRPDFVVATGAQPARSDFVRGPDAKVAWFRDRGRLYRRQS